MQFQFRAGFFFLILICIPASLWSQTSYRKYLRTDSLIEKGLLYQHYSVPESEDGPLSIHLLTVDLEQIRLELALAMDQIVGQETVSSLVARKGALAGINGSFSFSNDPWNLFTEIPKTC